MMDKQLEQYFNQNIKTPLPFVSEQKIQGILEARQKRQLLIAVSFAALLWVALAVASAVLLYQIKPLFSYAIVIALFAGLVSSGLFSVLTLKYRKVGVE